MCGRFARPLTDDEIAAQYGVAARVALPLPPSWNVAPTQNVRIIREVTGQRTLDTARWGLVPHWAKDVRIGARMINARAETIVEKPAFSAAARRRRAIVPMGGYYEWQVVGPRKVPHYLTAKTGEPLAAAGLFEFWRASPADDWLLSCTIITTTATDTLGHIHDRAPLLLSPTDYDAWLDPELTDPGAVAGLVAGIAEPELRAIEVGGAVGNVRNDGPELIIPVAHSLADPPATLL